MLILLRAFDVILTNYTGGWAPFWKYVRRHVLL